jgi:hypothetical protein
MVYLVTWELNREKPGYAQARDAFLAEVGRFEHIKDSGLDSVAFVSTSSSANDLSASLRAGLDDNDCLVVTRLASGTHQGWLSKATWDWINSRL